FPSLRVIFLTRRYAAMGNDISSFLDRIESTVALVRHDKFPEAPPYPRGGFLVGREMLAETLEYFFSLGRIVALYEPADPLLNGHNLNLLFENDREIRVEIVGPGFDMSDIKRGDLSPHESFFIGLSADGQISEMKLLQRISESAYVGSLSERKAKINEKLYAAPEPTLARKIRTDLGISDDLDSHLRKIGSALTNSSRYEPIAERALSDTVQKIVQSGTIKAFSDATGAHFPYVFSTSFINKGQRQVFWDIVSPTLKYQGLLPK
ncbi:MAG TPA: hypothetical protein VGY98_11550, partial [Verrucomicrobiae bacterium]|nr:hypothetical protein [Verrucomicrobiae bacterium]